MGDQTKSPLFKDGELKITVRTFGYEMPTCEDVGIIVYEAPGLTNKPLFYAYLNSGGTIFDKAYRNILGPFYGETKEQAVEKLKDSLFRVIGEKSAAPTVSPELHFCVAASLLAGPERPKKKRKRSAKT